MKQIKKIFAIALTVITVAGMTACGKADKACGDHMGKGSEAAAEAASSSKKTKLVYGSGDYTRINPAMDEHSEISVLLFDGLTDHDGSDKVIPRLAKSWKTSDDGKTYTFNLQENVKWHDGKPFTAEDVKFTIEGIMDPKNESENAPNYEDVEKIEVKDPHTVVFHLKAPNYAFLEYMTMPIMPKHCLEGEKWQESKFFQAPIGTGPYKLSKWEHGQAIIMEKNPDYFAGPAKIDEIIFKIVPEDNARALQLKSGELNIAQVTPKDAAGFKDSKNLKTYAMTTSDYRGILYNFANEYWKKNADLIPAINYAIDRQAIIDTVLLGHGVKAYSPIQRNVYNFDGVEKYDFNLSKSEELFKAAGCTKGADGFWMRDNKRIGFTINAMADDHVRIDMAQVAAQQLQSAGLDVKAAVPAEGIDWGGQEACIIGWGSPFDADDHTYKVFGTGKGANYSAYSDKLVDQYLTEARQTDDPAKRKEAYAKFQTELAKKPPYTFFCYIDAMYVADSKIKGIDPKTVLGHHGVGIFWNITDWTIG